MRLSRVHLRLFKEVNASSGCYHSASAFSILKTIASVIPETRLLVTEKFTFPSVLTRHCGVVPGIVDRWHHLLLLSLRVYMCHTQTEFW